MTIRITGMNSGLDTEAIIQELVSAKSYKKTKLEKAQTKLEWKQEAWKTLNTKIHSFYTQTLSDFRFESSFLKKITTCSNSSAVKVTTGATAPYATQTISVNELATNAYMTGGRIGDPNANYYYYGNAPLSTFGITGDTSIELTVGGETKTIELTADTTLDEVAAKISETGLNANFDVKNRRFYISSNTSGEAGDFSFGGDVAALKALGLSNDAGLPDEARAKKVDGKDAEIVLNGVTYHSSDNVFEINGLTITAQEKTTTQATISTKTDTDGIYDMVKNFITKYNELINEMDKLYNADSSKGYEPLSDDEKEEMSESEIEKWETKIKDSLLRKDSTLSSVASAMKEVMAQGVTMKDGSKLYLFDFGIETLGYFNAADNEKNAYHIHGNKDDASTANEEDKLSAAIATDPEAVTAFFTGLAKNLYGTLTEKMAKVPDVSSAFTVYNDLSMKKEYDDYTEKITAQQKKVDAYMDKYYAKFSAMETALAKMQSNSNAVTQLLGM